MVLVLRALAAISLLNTQPSQALTEPESLKVISLDPVPNYVPTRDERDAAQLTDRRAHSFPFWTNQESVGWESRTPVVITLEAQTREGGDYELVLRTARQTRAGVEPPRRIDVYCGTRFTAAWRHVGGLVHAVGDSADARVVDLIVPLTGCGGTRLQAVIHAQGAFIMLDELTLNAGSDVSLQPSQVPAPVVGRIDDPRTDSTQRLEAALQEQANRRLAGRVQSLPPGESQVGLARAWDVLDKPLVETSLVIHALPTSHAQYVIGIANADAVPHRFSIDAAPAAGDGPAVGTAPTLNPLSPILAADGRTVFDAIAQPTNEASLVAAHTLSFVLVSEPTGARSFTRRWLVSNEKGWSQQVRVDYKLYDLIRPTPEDTPRVLVWTYTRDAPIWSKQNAQETVENLVQSGVNVFEIHPSDLPQPFLEDQWRQRTTLLREQLALFRGRGLLLLFFGDEVWQSLRSMPHDQATYRRLARWLLHLTENLRESGYGMQDWAMYLLDEPHGSDLGRLADIIDLLHTIEPSLRFYANPIAGNGWEISTGWRLRQLQGRVDYWQPRAGKAFENVRALVDPKGGAELWWYANPPEPARSALPACYRDIGRKAFEAAARGVGFWSLSDTGNSSAWSDFDGQRPDWSVVYEDRSKNHGVFLPGRRWRAFVQGVADFAALHYCGRESATDPALARQCTEFRAALDSTRPDCAGWW